MRYYSILILEINIAILFKIGYLILTFHYVNYFRFIGVRLDKKKPKVTKNFLKKVKRFTNLIHLK